MKSARDVPVTEIPAEVRGLFDERSEILRVIEGAQEKLKVIDEKILQKGFVPVQTEEGEMAALVDACW